MKAREKNLVLGIYKRVALYNQIESESALDDQEQKGIEMAEKLHWDYEVFSDLGISGAVPYGERPGLSRLVEKCILGDVTGIFVSNLDRLSRSYDQGQELLSWFIKYNIRLFDASGEVNLHTGEADLQRLRENFKVTK